MQGYEAINDNMHRYAYMLINILINKNIKMLLTKLRCCGGREGGGRIEGGWEEDQAIPFTRFRAPDRHAPFLLAKLGIRHFEAQRRCFRGEGGRWEELAGPTRGGAVAPRRQVCETSHAGGGLGWPVPPSAACKERWGRGTAF